MQLFKKATGLTVFCTPFFLVTGAQAAAPIIGGSVDITATTGNVINTATDIDTIAQVAVGSILEGEMSGDYRATVTVGDIVNSAEVSGSCAQVIIGSVGTLNCPR